MTVQEIAEQSLKSLLASLGFSADLEVTETDGIVCLNISSPDSQSVSYTHLDVYKRQRYVRPVHIPRHSLKNWRTIFNNFLSRDMVEAGFTS